MHRANDLAVLSLEPQALALNKVMSGFEDVKLTTVMGGFVLGRGRTSM